MGKQINYYMEYEKFIPIAEKAIELGCEIICADHTENIIRGCSADVVTPEYKHYYFRTPDADDVAFALDVHDRYYVKDTISLNGLMLIEAGYSHISDEEKHITRGRLYSPSGYYNDSSEFIRRPESVETIYKALVKAAKKSAPYTEISEQRTDHGGTPYIYTHKVYISDRCLALTEQGYILY